MSGYVGHKNEDDGFWYVYRADEMPRPSGCRNAVCVLFEDQWPDGGEHAAKIIAAALFDAEDIA